MLELLLISFTCAAFVALASANGDGSPWSRPVTWWSISAFTVGDAAFETAAHTSHGANARSRRTKKPLQAVNLLHATGSPRGTKVRSAKAGVSDAGSAPSTTKPQRPRNSGRVRRRYRRNDPFRQHRAVMGHETRISMWQRARAVVFLFVMVVILGAAVAGFIGLLAFGGMLIIDALAA